MNCRCDPRKEALLVESLDSPHGKATIKATIKKNNTLESVKKDNLRLSVMLVSRPDVALAESSIYRLLMLHHHFEFRKWI